MSGLSKWLVVAGLMLGSASFAKAPPKVVTGTANLNQASVQQLELLPGVGEKAAKKIVAHREKAPFARVEELVKVKGFGKKRLEKLRPYLSVSGPSTLAVSRQGAGAAPSPAKVQGRSRPGAP